MVIVQEKIARKRCHSYNQCPLKSSVVDPDPELLPASGSEIIVPDPDPAKHERADR